MHKTSKRRRYEFANDASPTKKQLKKEVKELKKDIDEHGHDTFKKRLDALEKKVDDAIETNEIEIKGLREEITNLKEEVKVLKAEKKQLSESFALAQATWLWEAHLARFVVTKRQIYPGGRFRQMTRSLKNEKEKQNWNKIQQQISEWTEEHWSVVKSVREERNEVAHPELIDLDLVEHVISKRSPEDQAILKDMLDMLKMTASLMKFGRLAAKTESSLKLNRNEREVLKVIILWDREYEQIGGLQNIEHEEAKTYLKMYLGESHPKLDDYLSVVDSIMEFNH